MPTATVIGAGPAGSTAAILLAQAGWEVTVVEQHAFPRDKVCGECLSHLGFEVLARLRLAGAFLAAGAGPLTRAVLHAPSGTSAEIALPNPMWGLSRRRLDPLLLGEAVRCGARLLQPCRAESLAPPAVTVRDLRTNARQTIESDWLLLADGRSALLPSRPTPTGDLGIKAHFTGIVAPAESIELFGLPRHYLGLAPIESGLYNVAYAVPEGRVRQTHGDLEALFRQMLTENATMARRFAKARRVGEWLAAPLPRFPVVPDWLARTIPVGNAAAALEPIGGEGMGLALRSAELAAEALIASAGDPPLRELRAAYHDLWRVRRSACRAGALVLSRPMICGVAVDLLNAIPSLARPSLRLAGK